MMLKKRVIISFVLLVGSFVSGCGDGTIIEEKVNNVVRIFWHEGDRYSLLVRDGDQLYFKMLPHRSCTYTLKRQSPVRVFLDGNNGLWANVKIIRGASREADPCLLLLELHIRDEADISGGAWNHGKFGSGQTHVIQ